MEKNGDQCCDFVPAVMNIFSDNFSIKGIIQCLEKCSVGQGYLRWTSLTLLTTVKECVAYRQTMNIALGILLYSPSVNRDVIELIFKVPSAVCIICGRERVGKLNRNSKDRSLICINILSWLSDWASLTNVVTVTSRAVHYKQLHC
jgi:hypothetical protein